MVLAVVERGIDNVNCSDVFAWEIWGNSVSGTQVNIERWALARLNLLVCQGHHLAFTIGNIVNLPITATPYNLLHLWYILILHKGNFVVQAKELHLPSNQWMSQVRKNDIVQQGDLLSRLKLDVIRETVGNYGWYKKVGRCTSVRMTGFWRGRAKIYSTKSYSSHGRRWRGQRLDSTSTFSCTLLGSPAMATSRLSVCCVRWMVLIQSQPRFRTRFHGMSSLPSPFPISHCGTAINPVHIFSFYGDARVRNISGLLIRCQAPTWRTAILSDVWASRHIPSRTGR